jgi:hypothetical protein
MIRASQTGLLAHPTGDKERLHLTTTGFWLSDRHRMIEH